jgi:hypothetical protein
MPRASSVTRCPASCSSTGRIDPVDPGSQPQPHPRGAVLQVGNVVVAGWKRPAAATDPGTGLMGEHPVRIQPKMVMAFPPGRGHQIGLVNHERIKTSPPDRPGSRQTSTASTHDHNMLIHDVRVDSFPLTVNRRRPPLADGFPRTRRVP